MSPREGFSAQCAPAVARPRQVLAFALLVCIELLPGPRPADAQTLPAYPGLFGQNERDAKRPQSLDLAMSVTNGYDTANDLFGVDPISLPVQTGGPYSNIDAVLRYTRASGRHRLMVTASDTMRYEPVLQNTLTSSYQTSVGFAAPLGRRGHLELNQDLAYTPYYQINLFPALPVDAAQIPNAPSNEYALARQTAYSYGSSAGLSFPAGRRSSLVFGFDRRSVVFNDAARDLTTNSGSARLLQRVTPRLGFHLGVSAHSGRYGAAAAQEVHTEQLDAGVDYSSRRTTFSASFGPVLIPVPGGTTERLTANAAFGAQLSRQWIANVQYDRSLRFVEALAFPFFADSISIGVTGQPARRLGIGGGVGYSTGTVGVSAEGGAYGTYTGSAQVTVPLNRHYAFSSEYLYYHYGFTEQAFVGALPPRLGRQTLRIGLKLWLPLMN